MHKFLPAAALLFLLAIPAYGQLEVGPNDLNPVSDPFGSCMDADTPDQCMNMGSTTTTMCNDSWGCPQCGMNDTKTNSLCYRIYGNYGWCSCSPDGTYRDRNGNIMPRCKLKGACNAR